jgi:hypothetical protein|eukprot:COSAG01_NODE_2792_length_7061_cov_20.067222_7_plen_38_part_00
MRRFPGNAKIQAQGAQLLEVLPLPWRLWRMFTPWQAW